MTSPQFAPWREPENLTPGMRQDIQNVVQYLHDRPETMNRVIAETLPMAVINQIFGPNSKLPGIPPTAAEFTVSLCHSLFRQQCPNREPMASLGAPKLITATLNMLVPIHGPSMLTSHLNHPLFNPAITEKDVYVLCGLLMGLHVSRAVAFAHESARQLAAEEPEEAHAEKPRQRKRKRPTAK
jgi:hypothetical protein